MAGSHDVDVAHMSGLSLTLCEVIAEELHELKWAVLAVACFLTFGSYYVFDFPGSIGTGSGDTIEQHFHSHGKEYTQAQNQILYSVYSWPNTVLAIFGGLLIDRYLGLRRGMLLFTTLVLLGSVLFFFGVWSVSYPLMLAGRVIFGLGGESLSVSQSAFVSRWFKDGRGMAMAFGITISCARVGSSFNFIFSPAIAARWGVTYATLAGVGACLISVVCCAVLICADTYAVHIGYVQPEAHADSIDEESETSRMRASDILKLPVTYWLLCIVCVTCYVTVFPFIGIAKNFFEVKYGYSGSEAAKYISAYQLTSAASSPVIGLVVDTAGRHTWWLILASLSFFSIHAVFVYTMVPALPLMVTMGCCYGFLASGLWPSIPWVVEDNIVAFSYGVMTAIQNVGFAALPTVVGSILDQYQTSTHSPTAEPHPSMEGFIMAEYVFMTTAAVSLTASVALLVCDLRCGGTLSASSSVRKKMLLAHPDEQQALLGEAVEDSDAMT